MADLSDKKDDSSQGENKEQQSEGDQESKDQEQDPKPENNVNLQTGELSTLNKAQKTGEQNQKNNKSA